MHKLNDMKVVKAANLRSASRALRRAAVDYAKANNPLSQEQAGEALELAAVAFTNAHDSLAKGR